ncbi:MAG: MBOAT family protein [Lachnospiraceae bacterium]|nr:MBOAT family protein [Lachnospiraceae bacterium]
MLFTSYSFIGFLTILFLLYYSVPKKYQWKLLLMASYIFYAFAGAKFLLYIAATTITTWYAALRIERIRQECTDYRKLHKAEMTKEEKKSHKQAEKKQERVWLLFCLFFNFGILAVVKYTNFAIANINYFLNMAGKAQLNFFSLALPMGISFYTFQSMGYLIDVYRDTNKPEKNLGKFALFVAFFPQLIQGPISRFADLSKSLCEEHGFNKKQVLFGVERILWGFFKKLVLADRIVAAVNTIIHEPETYQGVYVFIGMLFYAYELYADFTGGIDITIGVAQVFGVSIKENFERPYFSKSIKEYWRRWHITMGTWFTDYIFYPVSVSTPMLKLSKFSRAHFGEAIGKRVPVYCSTILVWFTTGIWHGASWNFIVWGLMNCLVIMVSQELEPFYRWFHARFKVRDKWFFRAFQVIRTVLLMSALRMFDCYRDVPLTFKMFADMLTNHNFFVLFEGGLMNLGLTAADYVILTAGLVVLLMVSLKQRGRKIREELYKKPWQLQAAVIYLLFFAVLIFGAYGIGYDASQFIYNQF